MLDLFSSVAYFSWSWFVQTLALKSWLHRARRPNHALATRLGVRCANCVVLMVLNKADHASCVHVVLQPTCHAMVPQYSCDGHSLMDSPQTGQCLCPLAGARLPGRPRRVTRVLQARIREAQQYSKTGRPTGSSSACLHGLGFLFLCFWLGCCASVCFFLCGALCCYALVSTHTHVTVMISTACPTCTA